ncbi:MAG: hypothetical protein SGPRY_012287, partial [Prymnesium sp.]
SEYIWCVGEVVEVADDKTTNKTPKCKNVLPWGAIRIKFPEVVVFEEGEHFIWSVLKPCDWRKDVHLGWRFGVNELKKLGAARLCLCRQLDADVVCGSSWGSK